MSEPFVEALAPLDQPPAIETAQPPPKHIHPALFGLLIIPFGIVTGYCGVTLPRVLGLEGVATDVIANFQAVSQQPHSLKFIIEPTLDARWRKRSWFLWSIAVTAVTLLAAVFVNAMHGSIGGLGRMTLLAAILFIANAAVATSSGACYALMAITLPKEKKGSASGWAMAGNLGGYGVGGAIGLFLTRHLPTPLAAISMAACVVLAAAPALFIKEDAAPSHPIFRAVANLLKDAWKTLKSREGWTGFLICLSPVGAGGCMGLFSDMAAEYGAGDNHVALVNGLFGGIVSAIGCVFGGYVADRMNRRAAYALAGGLCGVIALGMAFCPFTPRVYTIGCLSYQFMNGIAYATWAAFVLDLMGKGAGVATKHAILAAAANQATNYMLVFDGHAAVRKVLGVSFGSGSRAILRADAAGTAAGLVFVGMMFVVVKKLGIGRPAAPGVAEPSPSE